MKNHSFVPTCRVRFLVSMQCQILQGQIDIRCNTTRQTIQLLQFVKGMQAGLFCLVSRNQLIGCQPLPSKIVGIANVTDFSSPFPTFTILLTSGLHDHLSAYAIFHNGIFCFFYLLQVVFWFTHFSLGLADFLYFSFSPSALLTDYRNEDV